MTATTALLILGAAALDVLANVLLKRSDGLARPAYFVGAVLTVLAAFSLIGLAARDLPVAVAYALWGGLGIVTTALLSRHIDGARLTPTGWAGLALILGSLAVLSRTP
ncbi:SMR family transporter [Deinococcus soli (ex Cha et al. 2016)]|uniref:Spermidine export protein MdtI n=1 Tax=Deinococcus soli (ex Cha et al. 2016) TaxID=1309411 RepID=A0A0F7JTR6_9DEIO|nr:SMR family transporter [Deinococcus soli (ex Cha et al. 2016)]AKH18043.1 ligand-binding protein SH3 [Deinococcus soli (ex Cha et al. 2016)]